MPKRKRRETEYEFDDDDEEDDEDDEEDFEATVDDFVSGVFAHPKVKGVIGAVSRGMDRFAQLVDQISRAQPAATPQAPPRPKVVLDPYVILGFSRETPLTVDMIKERKRQYAKILHPDTGTGDAAAMARVNRAAEILIAKLTRK